MFFVRKETDIAEMTAFFLAGAILVLAYINRIINHLPSYTLEAIGFLIILSLLISKENYRLYKNKIFWYITTTIMILTAYLLPLPPILWTTLPGRDLYIPVITFLTETGYANQWQSITLNSHATASVILALFPPIAVFMLAQKLTDLRIMHLIYLMVILAVIQAIFGLGQYIQHNQISGSFANYNHYAAFLNLALPFSMSLIYQNDFNSKFYIDHQALAIKSGYILVVLIICTSIILSSSRAGTVSAIISVALTLILLHRHASVKRLISYVLMMILGLMTLGIAIMAWLPTRLLSLSINEDPRWIIFRNSINAVQHFFPLGSGLGTFADVYPAFQTVDTVSLTFVAHAHNEYLELFIETGIIGMLALTILIGLFIRRLVRLCSKHYTSINHMQLAAASAIIVSAAHASVEFNFHVQPYTVFWAALMGIFWSKNKERGVTVVTVMTR